MSMDKRFRSDKEWFISPVVDLSVFLRKCIETEEAFSTVAMPSTSSLDKYRPDSFPDDNLIEEDLANKEIIAQLQALTNCDERIAEKIMMDDLSLDLLRGHDGKNEYNDDATTFDERNPIDKVPADCKLQTIQYAVKRQKQMINYSRKSAYLQDGRYYRYDYGVSLKRTFINSIRAETEKDFIMTCSMPSPNNKVVGGDEVGRGRWLRAAIKMVVRGQTTLLEFRKKMICPCDMHVDIEPGKWLEPPDVENKAHFLQYPSSFIFIHDTFYVDSPNDCDISEPIREFMAKDKHTFGKSKVASIEGVRFMDLKLRLGQPYVMMHSGECEHLLIFHDLRMLSPFDEQDLTKYPMVVFEKGGELWCLGCKRFPASMTVENCELLPQSPAFLCKSCFKEFLLDANGEPVTSFVANHYYQANKLII